MEPTVEAELARLEYGIGVYRFIAHINGALSVLTAALAIYLIVVESTDKMKAYRPYLINICVSFLNGAFGAATRGCFERELNYDILKTTNFCFLGHLKK